MGAQNQQRPDLEQIIRERQDAARQAMYASGSEAEQSAPTDFAGVVKRAALTLFAGTGLAILSVVGAWLVGHTVMFAMLSLGASSIEAGLGAILVTVLFFVGSVAAAMGVIFHLEEAIVLWIKTGRTS